MTSEAVSPRWPSELVPPEITGDLDTDAPALATFIARGERSLAALPAKPDRDTAQQAAAERVLTTCRAARRRFAARHAAAVYDVLTEARTRHLRLQELVTRASERFPGVVPDREVIDAERPRVQAHRDGRETDHAAFISEVLRSPRAGRHLIDAALRPSTGTSPSLRARFVRDGRVDLETVGVRRHGAVAEVTLRRTERLNAENTRLVADLEIAVDLVLLDDEVRVGVLRGAPMTHPRYAGRRVFCSGIDLSELRNGGISYLDFMLGRELSCVGKLLHGVLVDPDFPAWSERVAQKPWICAVEGFAIGGGMQLALVCDRVIAERDAYFSLPAAQEGIVPGLANLRLGRFTGGRPARRIILGGATVRATDPSASLLCDEVVAAGEMDDAVRRAAAEMSAPAVTANRRMLILAEEPVDRLREYLAEFAVVQAARMYSPDVLEKVERRWAERTARKSARAGKGSEA